MSKVLGRALASVVCVVCLAAGAAPARGAAPEPDFVLTSPLVSALQTLHLDGPCGLTASSGPGSSSSLLLSNYYSNSLHGIDLLLNFDRSFAGLGSLSTRAFPVDPLSGPCGLARDSAGRLYVNNYHRNVVRYSAAGGPEETPTVIDSGDPTEPGINPTGVAVDLATDTVYVNNRTYIAAYGPTGAPLTHEGSPLRIGEGSLGDGYGIAVSEFPATAGRIYVPDHSDETIKVYDPGVSAAAPVAVIDGAGLPGGGFGSLRDSAIAIDRVSGALYVADTRPHPQYTERPTATIYVLGPDGSVDPDAHRLKYEIVDPSPPGLAIDNTAVDPETHLPVSGRVFVTSGNADGGEIFAYPPGAATAAAIPLLGEAPAPAGPPAPAAARSAAPAPAGRPAPSRARASEVAQKGNLRVSVSGRLAPKRLPREGVAPIRVSVGGEIATTDDSLAPQLKTLQIELNRNGRLDRRGLPRCRYEAIQPGSSQRALAACREALVGEGSFEANIILAGQEPYPTSGRLLVFNAQEKGRPVLFGHIHTAHPFASSFVIVFELGQGRGGTYGTTLHARIPRSMDAWGRLTALEMTLGRRYRAAGEARSYISAGCPAPEGFPGAIFPLARTTFAFTGGRRISSVLVSECEVRG